MHSDRAWLAMLRQTKRGQMKIIMPLAQTVEKTNNHYELLAQTVEEVITLQNIDFFQPEDQFSAPWMRIIFFSQTDTVSSPDINMQ